MSKTTSELLSSILPIALLAVMLSLSPFKAYAGFGVSPSLIQEQRLVPGATIERTFYLIQGTPENSVDVNFTIESATAASWVTILDIEGSSLTIPEGVQQFPVKVKIQVPPDAPENIHRVFIRTNTIPEGGTGQVAIAMSAKLELELTVGDEIYKEFKIRDVQLQDIPVNGQPTVTVKIENTGNVPSGPDSATFELFNKFGDLRLAYAQIDGTIEEVPGFTEETVTVKFPLDIKIGLGEYWGTVKLYEADKLVREEKSVFRVLDTLPSEEVDVPSPENKATVKSFLDNSINSSLGRIVLGAFLGATLVLFIAFLLTRKRKK